MPFNLACDQIYFSSIILNHKIWNSVGSYSGLWSGPEMNFIIIIITTVRCQPILQFFSSCIRFLIIVILYCEQVIKSI